MSNSAFKRAAQVQGPGFNKYVAHGVENEPTQEVYQQVERATAGSLTSDINADVRSKFDVALATMTLTPAQADALRVMADAFVYLEDVVHPDQLSGFKIREAADGEVCIYRTAGEGLINLVVDEDGEWAYLFSAFKGSQRPNDLKFLGQLTLEQAKNQTYVFFPG